MAKELTIDIHHDSPDPLYIQLKDQVKEYIIRNALTKGTALPSIKIIAEKAGVTLQTSERGMTELIREGICFRRPKKGTFVGDIHQKRDVKSVGVFFNQNLNISNQFEFYSNLSSQVCEQLTQMDIQTMVWMDSRDEKEKAGPPRDLIEAIEEQKIQYMFVVLSNDALLDYLESKNIPYSIIKSVPGNNVIYFDPESLLLKTFEAFSRMGVKTVGMITNETGNRAPSGKTFKPDTLCRSFMKAAENRGLDTRFDWIKSPVSDADDLEKVGYDLFMDLWDEEETPEGLFVFPDTVARGVISAILKRSLNIPEDLQLAFHKNREVHLFHPFPAVHVVNVVENVTYAFIKQLTAYINGEKRQQQTIKYKVAFP